MKVMDASSLPRHLTKRAHLEHGCVRHGKPTCRLNFAGGCQTRTGATNVTDKFEKFVDAVLRHSTYDFHDGNTGTVRLSVSEGYVGPGVFQVYGAQNTTSQDSRYRIRGAGSQSTGFLSSDTLTTGIWEIDQLAPGARASREQFVGFTFFARVAGCEFGLKVPEVEGGISDGTSFLMEDVHFQSYDTNSHYFADPLIAPGQSRAKYIDCHFIGPKPPNLTVSDLSDSDSRFLSDCCVDVSGGYAVEFFQLSFPRS